MTDLAVASAPDGAAPVEHGPQAVAGAANAAAPSQLISFAIGDDQYGVDIMAVREIKGWTDITPLPRQPQYVRGVLNLRGIIVPIVDLRCRFGQGLTEPTPQHVYIVVQIGARQVGLLADGVSDIVSVARADIKPVPDASAATARGFLSGLVNVDDSVVGLIDLDSVLETEAEAA